MENPASLLRSYAVTSPKSLSVRSCPGNEVGGRVVNSKFEIRNSKSDTGEELPRGSLDPGDSLEKVGIMVGFKGRYVLVGGRNPADTRWACRRPQKPSGLPRNETSRD